MSEEDYPEDYPYPSDVRRGKDARLQKWQKRLEDALPGSSGYASALGMVRQLSKPPSAGIDMYSGAGSTAQAYKRPSYHTHTGFAFDGFPNTAEHLDPMRYTTPASEFIKKAAEGIKAQMYVAPVGKQAEGWPDGWLELGYTTDEGASFSFEADINPDNLRAALNGSTLTSNTTNPLRKAEQMISDPNATADELEQAALNLAAQAAAIRKFDATEPQGDEPTISFTHKFAHSDKVYTFVAFKCNREGGTDKWHLSGEQRYSALTWREMGARFDAIAKGDFLVAAKWAPGVTK